MIWACSFPRLRIVTFHAVVQQLFQRAHEYANLANRAGAIASDVLLSCENFDITPKELYQVKKSTLKRKRGTYKCLDEGHNNNTYFCT